MKIAIIGGGAAGMISAYLLDKAGHHVTVLEKQDKLGGNIRTTNKNVVVPGLAEDLFLEGGVIEFSAKFHRFQHLMEELEIPLLPVDIGTGLFLENGQCYLSSIMIENNRKGWQRLISYFRYYGLQLSVFSIGQRAKKSKSQELRPLSMQAFLNQENNGTSWLKNFSMYSYSIPFEQIANLPSELGIPSIRDYMLAEWFRMKGGTYSYIEKIIARFSGTIILNAKVQSVERKANEVHIQWNNTGQSFDKVIFATPPDQVLPLIKQASTTEYKIFKDWKANHAQTIIHTDAQFYKRFKISVPSPFDFFETPKGWGYNAYLNDLCAVSGKTSYFLAYNMESFIDPQKIISVQDHHTPFYTLEAFQSRQELMELNGNNHTYFVGAYLGDGLHEGAVVSAERVLDQLSTIQS